MDLICLGRLTLLLWKEVGRLLVVTVEGHSGSVRKPLALCVILHNLPVFFDGDVYVAQLDLALLFLLDHRQFVPFH